jgi:hypothetical protein
VGACGGDESGKVDSNNQNGLDASTEAGEATAPNQDDGAANDVRVGECSLDTDCKVPTLTPADCAVAKCDPLTHVCHLTAKDSDGDGHLAKNCSAAIGTVETGDDCDDSDPNTHPGAWDGPGPEGSLGDAGADAGDAGGVDAGETNPPDRCDFKDQNCDGNPDNDTITGDAGVKTCKCDPLFPTPCYETPSGLGFPASSLDGNGKPQGACKMGARLCPNGVPGQCNGAVGPTQETCNSADDDCNGIVDDAPTAPYWFKDSDGDNYGDKNVAPKQQCSSPGTGWKTSVVGNTDCNDGDLAINPGHTEVCDSKDNDCNTVVDDAPGAPTWYKDVDGDNHGDKNVAAQKKCTSPGAGYVQSVNANDDCNDGDLAIYPGHTETCDSKDNDCNNVVDDAPGAPTWYKDVDGDNHGDKNVAPKKQCFTPGAGYVTSVNANDDCNDGDLDIFPGHGEVCDSKDNDCNSIVDDFAGAPTWYKDSDGDNHGDINVTPVKQCFSPGAGYVSSVNANDDCNDGTSAAYPGHAESCDGIDNNCAGGVDEGFGLGNSCTVGTYGVCRRVGSVVCSGGGTTCSQSAGTPVNTLQPAASTDPTLATDLNVAGTYVGKWDWNCDHTLTSDWSDLIFSGGPTFSTCQGNVDLSCSGLSQANCKSYHLSCKGNITAACGQDYWGVSCGWGAISGDPVCEYIGHVHYSTLNCK